MGSSPHSSQDPYIHVGNHPVGQNLVDEPPPPRIPGYATTLTVHVAALFFLGGGGGGTFQNWDSHYPSIQCPVDIIYNSIIMLNEECRQPLN